MRRFSLLIVVCVLAVFGLAACGGDDDNTASEPAATETATTETTTTGEGAGGAGATVDQAADPGGALEFVKSSLTAPTGSVTFEFANESSTPHDFVLEKDGEEVAKTEVITESTDSAEGTLDAGEYTFFCSVPGHRQAGMEGTLTAK